MIVRRSLAKSPSTRLAQHSVPPWAGSGLSESAWYRRVKEATYEKAPLRYELLLNANYSAESCYATLARELGHLYCGHLGLTGCVQLAVYLDARRLHLAPFNSRFQINPLRPLKALRRT